MTSWHSVQRLITGIGDSHNKFHNRIGGVKSVTKGTETMDYPGTMTAPNSTCDPIFWLHHSNVEWMLLQWQNYNNRRKISMPSDWLMDVPLYP